MVTDKKLEETKELDVNQSPSKKLTKVEKQNSTISVKEMQILMEGEVEKKKGKTMFASNKKYWMLLTN